jgi:GntR family transcriptional repressor for pyruvate dehydrogenase complex
MSFIPHPLAPTQGRTAADPTGTVALALVSLLLAQGVRAGEKIPAERVLTEELGVSRGALREAISQLSFVGLLESRHGSGTYFRGADAARMSDVMAWFSAFNGTDVAQVVDARWTIEVTVTRLAASRRSMSDLRDLRSCLGDMRTAGTREEFVASDLAFHRIVARSCSNTVLARLHAEIEVIAEHWVPRSLHVLDDPTGPYPEHADVFAAISDQDQAAAERTMHVHMARAVRRLALTLDEDSAALVRATARTLLLDNGIEADLDTI